MLLLRNPQLRATKVLDRTLSTRAVRTERPNPMSRETCMKAQMAHQEMKIRRNLYWDSGALAILNAFVSGRRGPWFAAGV
jgi:hypothetical protein